MLLLVLSALWEQPSLRDAAWWVMFFITTVTVASFFDYFRGNLPTLRDAWKNRPTRKRR